MEGSVLGPLPFIIYINDICNSLCTCNNKQCNLNCLQDVSLILFADDTNLFVEDKEDASLFAKADNYLKKIARYIDANYLHINLDKTKYMKFSSPRGKNISTKGISYHFKYENIIIKLVSNLKFLGDILNERIDWPPQISKVIRKISSINGILFNLRKFIPENLHLKKSIYFALVNSHLNYGISVWGCAGDKNKLQKLFVAQKINYLKYK